VVVDCVLRVKGRTRASLAGIMGGRRCVAEFFAGERGLSPAEARALRDELGIPTSLLLH
jgi:antitoxin component HigA of HigAB toxin-antitoxin module